ncbi:hypothetical protein OQA88_7187 [Cercophora sp. LCS_1]
MSVFLLLLPFLAARESYYGYAEDQHHHRYPRTQYPCHSILSTIGTTASLDTLTINGQYTALQDEMMRYLAGDTFNIREMEATSESKQTILKMKQAVLLEYQELKN